MVAIEFFLSHNKLFTRDFSIRFVLQFLGRIINNIDNAQYRTKYFIVIPSMILRVYSMLMYSGAEINTCDIFNH